MRLIRHKVAFHTLGFTKKRSLPIQADTKDFVSFLVCSFVASRIAHTLLCTRSPSKCCTGMYDKVSMRYSNSRTCKTPSHSPTFVQSSSLSLPCQPNISVITGSTSGSRHFCPFCTILNQKIIFRYFFSVSKSFELN